MCGVSDDRCIGFTFVRWLFGCCLVGLLVVSFMSLLLSFLAMPGQAFLHARGVSHQLTPAPTSSHQLTPAHTSWFQSCVITEAHMHVATQLMIMSQGVTKRTSSLEQKASPEGVGSKPDLPRRHMQRTMAAGSPGGMGAWGHGGMWACVLFIRGIRGRAGHDAGHATASFLELCLSLSYPTLFWWVADIRFPHRVHTFGRGSLS